MLSCDIINVFILTLVGTVTAMPDHLLCCPSYIGTFEYLDNIAGCWDEESNKTKPLTLSCPTYEVFTEEDYNSTITDSGTVLDKESSYREESKNGKICYADDTNFDDDETTKVVVLCIGEEDQERDRVLGYCMLVSAVIFFLTALVYAALPELRDLQGKSIINFCGSMGIGLGILSGSKLMPYSDLTLCAIRGFLTYFFLLASFFWTNAICLQILQSFRQPVVDNFGWKQFSWYALYAWGFPVVLTLCMAIVNFYPGNHIKPGIGLNDCWFQNTRQQWYYMYSVMTILIIANICIFIYASVVLWKGSISFKRVKTLKSKFVMLLRIFFIIGVTWIFEMISSVTNISVSWYILNIFNALQGPIIFILLVLLRKRVTKALLKRGCLPSSLGTAKGLIARDEEEDAEVTFNNANLWI